MRIKLAITVAAFVASAWGQAPPKGVAVSTAHGPGNVMYVRTDMGKWWQSPDIAKKLQLSPSQISQLDQTFLDHKLKLIDYGAETEKQDLKLQSLLDADVPNEGQIQSQIDQVLAARGKLEREVTFMNLDLRKALTLDQWKQLKALRGDTGAMDQKIMFMQKRFRTNGPGAPPPPEDLPPLPPGPGDMD